MADSAKLKPRGVLHLAQTDVADHDRPEIDRTHLRALLLDGLPPGWVRWDSRVRAITAVGDGRLRVDGAEHPFTGTGLRIRRQGVRRLEGFWGHCWQSALFPSGKGFGYIAYPPRPEGEPQYNEGYVFRGDGDLVPARVVEAPWLTRLHPAIGAEVPVVLETADGIERIDGVTVLSTHNVQRGAALGDDAVKTANWSFPPLQQACVRYTWDGEQAIGMLERSNMPDRVVDLHEE